LLGVRALAGGSAADTAIAVQLVLNLVEPHRSGVGGGAFFVHWDARARELVTIDGRETAAAAAKPDRFLGPDGKPMEFADAVVGGRSVGVLGTVRLLEAAHKAGCHGSRCSSPRSGLPRRASPSRRGSTGYLGKRPRCAGAAHTPAASWPAPPPSPDRRAAVPRIEVVSSSVWSTCPLRAKGESLRVIGERHRLNPLPSARYGAVESLAKVFDFGQ